jgi:hypothetical protein
MEIAKVTDDRRAVQRHRVHVPVRFGSAVGATLDISRSGVFFETRETATPGQTVSFSILFPREGSAGISLDCQGRVVRVDHLGLLAGVAATIERVEIRTQ